MTALTVMGLFHAHTITILFAMLSLIAGGAVVSLLPSTFVQGGLVDDIDAKVTDAKFCMFDYNGTADPVPALGLELEQPDGTKHEQYYSAGDAKFFTPSEDGKQLIPLTDKTAITQNSKIAIFLTALINAGFSADKLSSGDITSLKGLHAHFLRQADPKRAGLVRTGANADREQSTLVVTKILAMPGETPKATKATTTAAGAPKAAAGTAAVDVTAEAQSVLIGLLAANGGTIQKNVVAQLAFKAITKGHEYEAKKSAITQTVFSDAFLKSGAESGLWTFNGTEIAMVQ